MLVSTEVSKTGNRCLIGHEPDQLSSENNADPTSSADDSMGL